MPRKPGSIKKVGGAIFVIKRMIRDHFNQTNIEFNKNDYKWLTETLIILKDKNKETKRKEVVKILTNIIDVYYQLGSRERNKFLDAKKKYEKRQKVMLVISEELNKKLKVGKSEVKMSSKEDYIEYLLRSHKKYKAIRRDFEMPEKYL